MMDNAETARVLEEAADLLLRRGWTRGATESPDGSMCMVGAINFAASGMSYLHGELLFPVVMDARDEVSKTVGFTVIGFNDKVAKGPEDAYNALITTAKRLRELG